jgi:hypothetical protein
MAVAEPNYGEAHSVSRDIVICGAIGCRGGLNVRGSKIS